MANSKSKKKIVILKGKGKFKNQFRFLPIAKNGKKLSDRDFYTRKSSLLKMLEHNFPDWQIVDRTV
jgi:hypothetical protein